jgi:hypothetical protein
MFEEELELEKKEGGGYGALIIILALVGVLVGGIGYVFFQNSQTLKPEEASVAINANLPGPAMTHFKSGHIVPSVADKPDGPNYRLLEKAGLVKLNKAKTGAVDIKLTDAGTALFGAMPELSKTTDKEGNTAYEAPLATRKLVQVGTIKKLSPSRYIVEYTWVWEPNKLGDVFDASGAQVKAFSTWDRSVLIDKFGADYFHGDPKKTRVYVVKGDKGWKTATE